ncbi:MAG: hypothetical protein Q4C81_06540 [Kocuria sp.]|nr:hypothetical protein [Kocuria sp.]
MLKKAAFVVGFGAGFMVGSYMGREPFEKVQAKVTGVVEDPEVRRKVQEGTQKAATTVKEQAPVASEKVTEVAKSAAAKVAPGNNTAQESGTPKPGPAHRASESPE